MPAILAILVVAGAVFVWLTGAQLPSEVASHFDASGLPNGYMQRSAYLGFMLALVVGLPVLVSLSGQLARFMPPRLVSLPHRRYWLAPERRASTAAELGRRSLVLAMVVLVFLCVAHWLVVRANLTPARQLPQGAFWGCLVVFSVVVVAWVAMLQRRFHRVP